MKALLCEPEDRLGNQASASVFRPDALAIQARRSGFIISASRTSDGAEMIKACLLHTPLSIY
jgi:protein-serine/threonine kinase